MRAWLPEAGLLSVSDVIRLSASESASPAELGKELLPLAARAVAYGEKLEYSGPVYASLKVDGSRAVLSFTHVGGGLVAQGGDLRFRSR